MFVFKISRRMGMALYFRYFEFLFQNIVKAFDSGIIRDFDIMQGHWRVLIVSLYAPSLFGI